MKSNNTYSVTNSWGSSVDNFAGYWILGNRQPDQYIENLSISSSDGGANYEGTMQYNNEGPIGISATRISDGNTYTVTNSWGGTTGHAAGNWTIGNRAPDQYVSKLDITGDGKGNLTGTMQYNDEGPIGFEGKLLAKRIALYLGNEIFPDGNTIPVTTIKKLQDSSLTSPILGLINHEDDNLVFNDNENLPNGENRFLFSNTGDYIGPANFYEVCRKLRDGGQIKEIYASFSTSGTEFLKQIGGNATSKILKHLRDHIGINGIDLDYEGTDFSKNGALYFATDQIVKAKMHITAAPYVFADHWKTWVEYVQGKGGTVSWLNLQCYDGGGGNNPNQSQWNTIPAPILGGCWSKQPPSEVKTTVEGWAAGQPATPPAGPFSGGFLWAYSGIKSQYEAYMKAMEEGLG